MRHDDRDFAAISEKLKNDNEPVANDDDDTNDAFDDEDISTQTAADGKNKTEKPAERIKREREEFMAKAANGEVKPESSYFFYNFFNFIGMLSLVIAIICTCYLIYLGYVLHNYSAGSSNDVERRNLINSNPSYENYSDRAGSGGYANGSQPQLYGSNNRRAPSNGPGGSFQSQNFNNGNDLNVGGY